MDGAELLTFRQRLGLSQYQLARLLDLSPQTVYRWETGKQKIAFPAMLRLALERLEEIHQP